MNKIEILIWVKYVDIFIWLGLTALICLALIFVVYLLIKENPPKNKGGLKVKVDEENK